MPATSTRNALTRREMFVVITVLSMLMGLVVVKILQHRENDRRATCANKMHQVGVALNNHHDAYKKFPPVSTEYFPQTPGGAGTGFSWITRIRPFMEENGLYTMISSESNKFTLIENGGKGAFNAAIEDPNTARHYATVELDSLICPGFTGDPISQLSYSAPYSGLLGINAASRPPIGVGISTYVAVSATQIGYVAGLVAASPTTNPCDGVIVPNKGIKLRDVTDGASNTIMACETRERSLNSWIDGSINWVVGGNPNNVSRPTTDSKGLITMPTGGTAALNVGPGKRTPGVRYLTQSGSPNGYEWAWGPSSEHAGGIVMHVYADASVREQSDAIDPTIYLRLITRAGQDAVVDPGVLLNQ